MYKVLVQKKERGSPLGMIDCVLYDECDLNVHKKAYGLKPWYNSRYLMLEEVCLKTEMYLISKLRVMNYEIRHICSSYFAVSEDFFNVLIKKINLLEFSPLNITNTRGKKITERNYFIVRFGKDICVDYNTVLDESSKISWKKHWLYLKEIIINDNVDLPIFKINEVTSSQSGLFFKQNIVDEFIENTPCIGIDFIDIDIYPWNISDLNKYVQDLDNPEPLLLI